MEAALRIAGQAHKEVETQCVNDRRRTAYNGIRDALRGLGVGDAEPEWDAVNQRYTFTDGLILLAAGQPYSWFGAEISLELTCQCRPRPRRHQSEGQSFDAFAQESGALLLTHQCPTYQMNIALPLTEDQARLIRVAIEHLEGLTQSHGQPGPSTLMLSDFHNVHGQLNALKAILGEQKLTVDRT